MGEAIAFYIISGFILIFAVLVVTALLLSPAAVTLVTAAVLPVVAAVATHGLPASVISWMSAVEMSAL